MKTRDVYLLKEETISDSGTKIVDLDLTDPISGLTILYEATNGATSCVDHEIHDDVSKIEVVDGSDVLAGMSMLEWQALNCAEMKRFPYQQLTEGAAGTSKESCMILFGRHLWDLEYYLIPGQFKNPQLKLSHALTISATAGFATGTGKVTVIAHVIEEGVQSHMGFMMAKEQASFTSAASGDEKVELAADHPYRMIVVSGLLSTYRAEEIISKLKLSIDKDKRIPFEIDGDHLAQMNEDLFGIFRQKKELLSADDGTALLDIYDTRHADVRTTEDDHLASVEAIDAEKVSVGLYDLTTPGTPALQATAKVMFVNAYGVQPHAALFLPMGKLDNPADWMAVGDIKTLELILTQATASAACKVISQQVRS